MSVSLIGFQHPGRKRSVSSLTDLYPVTKNPAWHIVDRCSINVLREWKFSRPEYQSGQPFPPPGDHPFFMSLAVEYLFCESSCSSLSYSVNTYNSGVLAKGGEYRVLLSILAPQHISSFLMRLYVFSPFLWCFFLLHIKFSVCLLHISILSFLFD